MKIIEPRKFEVLVSCTLMFENYHFVCDENGVVDESKLQPLALENYRKCIASDEKGRFERYERGHSSPAIGGLLLVHLQT